MGITEFKAVVGMFMIAQIVIVPLILSDNKKLYEDLTDIIILPLLIVAYLGLKLIGSIGA